MKNNKYEDRLFSRIDRSINSLLNNWWIYELWILSPYDRKRIHSYISKNYENIISKSKGQWENRKMYLSINSKKIKSKDNKLTIDIDWNWI